MPNQNTPLGLGMGNMITTTSLFEAVETTINNAIIYQSLF